MGWRKSSGSFRSCSGCGASNWTWLLPGKTGTCLRDLTAKDIFANFRDWNQLNFCLKNASIWKEENQSDLTFTLVNMRETWLQHLIKKRHIAQLISFFFSHSCSFSQVFCINGIKINWSYLSHIAKPNFQNRGYFNVNELPKKPQQPNACNRNVSLLSQIF